MKKVLQRLCRSIEKGTFAYKRYRRPRTYFGIELHTCTEYKQGGFTLLIRENGHGWHTIFKHDGLGQFNLDGRPYKETLSKL